jgi:hypothetical protein
MRFSHVMSDIAETYIEVVHRLETYPTDESLSDVFAITASAGQLQQRPSKNNASPGADMNCHYEHLTNKRKSNDEPPRLLSKVSPNSGWNREHESKVRLLCTGRRYIITKKGYLDLGQGCADIGDKICVLFGGNTPYLLRQDSGHHRMIGECYVHGIMQGEVIEEWEAGRLTQECFELR